MIQEHQLVTIDCIAQYGKTSVGWFFGLKIHLVINHIGELIAFKITRGNQHDNTAAQTLLSSLHELAFGDKGYDSQEFVDTLESQGCIATIPSRKSAKIPREIDKGQYKERFLVEAFFSKIKHFRRVFSRFDKTTSAFSGFLHLAGALIWMR